VAFLLDEDDRLTPRVNPEIVAICSLTTPEQEGVLRPLLEAYLAETGSSKAAAILADWSSWKTRFKLLVPPSELAHMGLAEKQAVTA
jgi:glutamate synthase (ferredoxin)